MTPFPTVRTIALVALTLMSCSSSSGQACTAVGCPDSLDWRLDLPVPWDALRQSSITVCRNTECVTGDFASLTAPGPPGTGVGIQTPDPATRDASQSSLVAVTVWTEPSGFSMEIGWIPWVMGDGTDGDVYTMELHDANGVLLSQAATTVSTYRVSEPNGPECGPTCRFTAVDTRSGP